ncbi:MAG: DMT family transporter, partial [Burkholderiales bacterium]|nr:DMT family transporter [Burkholderiales bacterium]
MPTIALYLICVAIWSTTWIAITFQLGTVAPLASVAWRFALASAVIFSWCAWRRLPLRFDGSRHRVLALQGLLMFGIGYTLVYEAEARVVSGLVAVGYSASPIVNALWGRLLYRTPLTGPILLGGLLGIAGVTAIFGLEIAAMTAGTRAFHGVLLTAAAVLIQGIATVSMGRNAQRRIGVW